MKLEAEGQKPPMKDVTPKAPEMPFSGSSHPLAGASQGTPCEGALAPAKPSEVIDADGAQAAGLKAGLEQKFPDTPKKRQVKKKVGNKWVWVDEPGQGGE